ncbi:Low temperature viability protein, partial [Neoconidiobolus thromboides FSU 785]
MVKKTFINKKEATHFNVVHRSQHDPLVADGEASDYVLLPTLQSANLKHSKKNKSGLNKSLKPGDTEFEELIKADNENNRIKSAQFGIFFNDDYDYTQHLKPIGQSSDGVFISGKKEEKEKTKKSVSFLLPEEALPSEYKTDVGIMNQPSIPSDYHYGMDPDVLDALDALEDDAYVDDNLEEDFFDELDGSEGEYIQEEEEELDPEAGWEEHFKHFMKNKNKNESDDEEEGNIKNKKLSGLDRRTSASKYSMTSSVMFRNEKLTLLDDQFERIEEEYEEDEDEEDEEEMPKLVEMREDFMDIMDEFLENYEVVGKKMTIKMEGETGVEKFNHLRQSLIQPEIKEEVENDLVKNVQVDEKIINNWDCQSVLSTYSNIYNRPAMIVEPKVTKGQISLNSRGFPRLKMDKLSEQFQNKLKITEEEEEEEESEEESEDDKQKVHTEIPRDRNESKEDKKLRKQQIKLEKKERRQE